MSLPLSESVEHHSTTRAKKSFAKSSGASLPLSVRESKICLMGSHIRERIKAARNHVCMTQEQLGEMIGVTKSAVSMWETANPEKWTRPSLDNLHALSRITGASIEWFLDDSSDINPSWNRPADILSMPISRSRPLNKSEEAMMLFRRLSEADQDKVLAYLRIQAG